MPRTQTLDAQTHTQREGEQDLRGLARCLHPRGRRERSIYNYTRYKRITRFSQELSPEIINPKNELLPLFIGRKRKLPK